MYTSIDTIKLKVIHRLNAYLCAANRDSCLGSSLCILLWELLDFPGARSRIIGYTWEALRKTRECLLLSGKSKGRGATRGGLKETLAVHSFILIMISCP